MLSALLEFAKGLSEQLDRLRLWKRTYVLDTISPVTSSLSSATSGVAAGALIVNLLGIGTECTVFERYMKGLELRKKLLSMHCCYPRNFQATTEGWVKDRITLRTCIRQLCTSVSALIAVTQLKNSNLKLPNQADPIRPPHHPHLFQVARSHHAQDLQEIVVASY